MNYVWICFFLVFSSLSVWANQPISVGSKTFTESFILGEIISQVIEESSDVRVQRKLGLGGTGIIFQALKNGDVDLYAEYTGTLSEEILKRPDLKSLTQIRETLESTTELTVSESFGFNNTYALAVSQELAQNLKLKTISDLKKHSQLRVAINPEFNSRKDGFVAMKKHYDLQLNNVLTMEHALTYEAFRNGKADVVVVYSTDAKIKKMNMYVLEDNKKFFPVYNPVLLARKSFVKKYPELWAELNQTFVNKISNSKMVELNAKVEIEKQTSQQAAGFFLGKSKSRYSPQFVKKFLKRTKEHFYIVFISLFFSILVAVPLGILARRSFALGQGILLSTGLLQTIPSLALLCFLIPLFGTGLKPALIAIFLYGLLPIVRGTYSGLESIDSELLESAKAINLSYWQELKWVQIPLASVSIMSGIKTSAIINVGTATIAALIGAGGYGAYIIEGLTRNSPETILQGAVPAAGLALIMHLLFELIDRLFVPKGLRL